MGRQAGREDALVGTTLTGRWRILGVLGRGGMSTVYEAEDVAGGRVAIKVLHDGLERNQRTRERFLREGRLASGFSPADTARILDTAETPDGRPALIMELLVGQTLRKRCEGSRGRRLEADEALHVAERVATILALAHAKGIIHRDIKPENVFLTSDQQVKVLDFGVAALRDDAAQSSTVTQSGATLGTPAFMAPEQARGAHKEVDARTDVWALGATLFYSLTGRHVHEEASSVNESLIFAATQSAPPLARFRPELGDTVAPVVDRALAFDPRNRWSSMMQMREAIASARRALQEPAGGTAAQVSDTIETVEEGVPSFARTQPPQPRELSWLIALLPAAALITVLVIRAEPASDAHPAKRTAAVESIRVVASPRRTIPSQSVPIPQPPPTSTTVQDSAKPAAPPVRPRVTTRSDKISGNKSSMPAGSATGGGAPDDDVSNVIFDRRK